MSLTPRTRRGAAALAAVVLGAGGCSGAVPDRADPATTVPGAAKVALRWERIARFHGAGDQRTGPFQVAPGALQWRVTLSCTGTGPVRARVLASERPLVEAACPAREFGFSIQTGPNVVDVEGTAAWELLVDQQLDTPIAEPPLPGMTPRNRLASGRFYDMEQDGQGTVTLYRLPDGRRALRLDPFRVTTNTDLVVWASGAETPRTSEAALGTPHVQLADLKATAGTQNYVVPDDVPSRLLRSIVVWCVPVRIAYAAACFAPSSCGACPCASPTRPPRSTAEALTEPAAGPAPVWGAAFGAGSRAGRRAVHGRCRRPIFSSEGRSDLVGRSHLSCVPTGGTTVQASPPRPEVYPHGQ